MPKRRTETTDEPTTTIETNPTGCLHIPPHHGVPPEPAHRRHRTAHERRTTRPPAVPRRPPRHHPPGAGLGPSRPHQPYGRRPHHRQHPHICGGSPLHAGKDQPTGDDRPATQTRHWYTPQLVRRLQRATTRSQHLGVLPTLRPLAEPARTRRQLRSDAVPHRPRRTRRPSPDGLLRPPIRNRVPIQLHDRHRPATNQRQHRQGRTRR